MHMKSVQYLETLYNIMNREMGPIEAKIFVSDAVFNIISELQENSLPVTEDAISKKLAEKVSDYLKASKNFAA
jgi:hypothetical protein